MAPNPPRKLYLHREPQWEIRNFKEKIIFLFHFALGKKKLSRGPSKKHSYQCDSNLLSGFREDCNVYRQRISHDGNTSHDPLGSVSLKIVALY